MSQKRAPLNHHAPAVRARAEQGLHTSSFMSVVRTRRGCCSSARTSSDVPNRDADRALFARRHLALGQRGSIDAGCRPHPAITARDTSLPVRCNSTATTEPPRGRSIASRVRNASTGLPQFDANNVRSLNGSTPSSWIGCLWRSEPAEGARHSASLVLLTEHHGETRYRGGAIARPLEFSSRAPQGHVCASGLTTQQAHGPGRPRAPGARTT